MSWAMVFMVNHPQVQQKVQAELDRVVGRGRVPNWADKQDLPYTEATLHELQRKANILPQVSLIFYSLNLC